jgi:hypothetical protein
MIVKQGMADPLRKSSRIRTNEGKGEVHEAQQEADARLFCNHPVSDCLANQLLSQRDVGPDYPVCFRFVPEDTDSIQQRHIL